MGYRNLTTCIADLARHGHLIRIEEEIDARLEAAEIHRRVFARGGPALHFANVKGCRFGMVSNLFGTMDRTRFLFRDTLERVRRMVELKVDPGNFFRQPSRYFGVPRSALRMRPKLVSRGPVMANETTLDALPQLVSWPRDGGAFITLPLVYTENVNRLGWRGSNLGMYRVQISGGEYAPNREIGLHYQIHRGIGVHHSAAIAAGKPLRVNIFVGGAPAMSVAAVMPLPEGMTELGFAGALGGHRIPLITRNVELPIYAEADFCISGVIEPNKLLPEGPFGDHLGYYSLAHEFPVLRVEKVYHRAGAVWPFTVVGRPPQEDTCFGELIHEITGPIIPTVLPGVKGVHAVDAAGVHPLLLAIGSERYVPYGERRRPQELLTQANAILGQGQLSLAKYLLIAAHDDNPKLDIHDIPAMFVHILSRVDWRRDLHFQTRTTIDTLDYSGDGFNEGSKVVIAATGPAVRTLPTEVPTNLRLPDGFKEPRVVAPGILALQGPPWKTPAEGSETLTRARDTRVSDWCRSLRADDAICQFPLVVIVDDSEFTAKTFGNFLWVTFTRSNPASDVDGIAAETIDKLWGCRGSLVIYARIKPHHAPPLEVDAETIRRVDALAARGGALAKWL